MKILHLSVFFHLGSPVRCTCNYIKETLGGDILMALLRFSGLGAGFFLKTFVLCLSPHVCWNCNQNYCYSTNVLMNFNVKIQVYNRE